MTLAYVDEYRIGVLGVWWWWICRHAATIDHRFKAVATVVAANYGRIMREGDSSPDAALRTIDALGKQRTVEARGPLLLLSVIFLTMQKHSANAHINDIDIIEAVDYYTTSRVGKSQARLTNCDLPAPHRP